MCHDDCEDEEALLENEDHNAPVCSISKLLTVTQQKLHQLPNSQPSRVKYLGPTPLIVRRDSEDKVRRVVLLWNMQDQLEKLQHTGCQTACRKIMDPDIADLMDFLSSQESTVVEVEGRIDTVIDLSAVDVKMRRCTLTTRCKNVLFALFGLFIIFSIVLFAIRFH